MEKDKMPLGVFYQSKEPTYEKELLGDFNPSKSPEVKMDELKAIFSER